MWNMSLLLLAGITGVSAWSDRFAYARHDGWRSADHRRQSKPASSAALVGGAVAADLPGPGLASRPGRGAAHCVAARYCSTTLAGMRPRSLTAMPLSFAQVRMSTLRSRAAGVRAARRRWPRPTLRARPFAHDVPVSRPLERERAPTEHAAEIMVPRSTASFSMSKAIVRRPAKSSAPTTMNGSPAPAPGFPSRPPHKAGGSRR